MRIRFELVLVLLLGVVAAANAQAQASSSPAAAAASAADKDNKPVIVSSDGELLYTGSGGDGGYLSIASVMSSVWISAFAICSLVFAISGLAVAYQWPNPRFCCYRTPYSDAPASGAGRACCSLYTLNVGFLVAWMLMLGVMAVSRDIARILVCAGFVLVHGTAVGALRWQYKRKGRPAYPETQMGALGAGHSAAVGMPMHPIPMSVAVVGEPAAASASGGTWGAVYPPQQPLPLPSQQQQQQQQQAGCAPAAQSMPPLYGYPTHGAPAPAWAAQAQQPQQPAQSQQQQQQQQAHLPATTPHTHSA